MLNKFKFAVLFISMSMAAGVVNAENLANKGSTAKQAVYVDQILVEKSKRKMRLIGQGKILKEYAIRLGFSPQGHKQFEGDGRTPEGVYTINAKNPNSQFHLSLKISYPNINDMNFARSRGKKPGGNIFIHGGPPTNPSYKGSDWTKGCIGLSNKEIEEIYRYVRVGTKIIIVP